MNGKSGIFLVITALLISIPAFFINLGDQPVIDDEAIRGYVAYEMIKTNDFVTPSINHDVYLKKPPLYNWIIALSFQLFNDYTEFPLRVPMILSLYLFAFFIFYYFRKEAGTNFGLINAFLFITCGRIIIYESMHGLIDITYSMVIFVLFMEVYRAFNAGQLKRLFYTAYFLAAIGFMLKGLPTIVFTGITLLVLFISNKKFKLLFNWRHFAGIMVFVLLVGGYYWIYFRQNNLPIEEFLDVLFAESSRRTIMRFGIGETLLHLFSFPFELLYHFLPWSIMVLVLFQKGIIARLWKNPFLKYLSLIFLSNIFVYWTSPEFYPRYVLMLIPLLFGIISYFYLNPPNKQKRAIQIVDIIYGIFISFTLLILIVPFYFDFKSIVPGIWAICFIAGGIGLISAVFYWKRKQFRLYLMIVVILTFRIVFDLVVLPVRLSDSNEVEARNKARSLAEQTQGKPLYYYWNPVSTPSPYYGKQVVSYRFNYYLSIHRDEVIPILTEKIRGPYFISQRWNADKEKDIEILDEFQPAGHDSPLLLFIFTNQ